MNDDELMEKLKKYLPQVLKKLKASCCMERYAFLRKQIYEKDVSKDKEFQRIFNGLYKIRFCPACHYYPLMQKAKQKRSTDFAVVLKSLWKKTGRMETSFASKLIAIIYPGQAVYDSRISKHLKLKIPKYNDPERLEKFIQLYECLNKRMKNLIKHRLFATLKIQFNQAFGKYKLTDIRRLDLMLWALRTT